MSRVMQARIAFAIIGVVVWGYGTASDNPNIRLAGIALLALSLILRFADRRPRQDPPDAV
jgi:hypothetical protein